MSRIRRGEGSVVRGEVRGRSQSVYIPEPPEAEPLLKRTIFHINQAFKKVLRFLDVDGRLTVDGLPPDVMLKSETLPSSSTDNAIARWNGTSGKTLQNSGVVVNDNDEIDIGSVVLLSGQNVSVSGVTYESRLRFGGADDWTLGIDSNDDLVFQKVDFAKVVTISDTTGEVTLHGAKLGVGPVAAAEALEVEDGNATTTIQVSNTATDGDPQLAFALSGTKTFTMGVDDGDSDKFKIGTTAIGTNTRLTIDSSGNVGLGTASPGDELHVNASTTAKATIESEDASNTAVGLVNTEATWNLTNLSDGRFVISLSSSGINELVIDDSNGYVGVRVASPASPLHVDQESSTGAVPVLTLDQGDDSEEMIEFIGTIGTGNAIEAVGAKTLTTTHFIKVTLPGGLTRYIPVGTIA